MEEFMKTVLLKSSILLCLSFGGSIEAALSWAEPERLSEAGREARVIIDDQKEGVAIWMQDEPELERSITSSFYTENSWQSPLRVSLTGIHRVEQPCVVYHNKQGLAIWSRDHRYGKGIRTASCSNHVWFGFSTLYQAPKEVDSMNDLEIAYDSDSGRGIATWVNEYLGHNVLMSALYADGKWSKAEARTGEVLVIQKSHVKMDGKGNSLLVWYEFDGEKNSIQSAVLAKDAMEWTATKTLSEADEANNPELALNKEGEALVAWLCKGQKAIQIVSYKGGEWSEVSEPVTIEEGWIYRFSLAMNNHGNALLTWAHDYRLYGARKLNNNWSEPSLVLQKGWRSYETHKVVLNDAEKGVVVYDAVEGDEDPKEGEMPRRIAILAHGFSEETWEDGKEMFPESMWRADISLNQENQVCVVASTGLKIGARFGQFE